MEIAFLDSFIPIAAVPLLIRRRLLRAFEDALVLLRFLDDASEVFQLPRVIIQEQKAVINDCDKLAAVL